MNSEELLNRGKTTYSVSEIREMLGIGKTESYWLLQHRHLETKVLCGKMRIVKASFEYWYDNQVKYRKVDGSPPGSALKEWSYSVHELAELLGVSDSTVYVHLEEWGLETVVIDYTTRITKDSFARWYAAQEKYRRAEDRETDRQLLEETYSMPELRRMLNVHRNVIYFIVDKEGKNGAFEFVSVAGQKRITKASFWRWYESQSHYKITEQTEPPAPEKEETAQQAPTAPVIPVKTSYRVEDLIEVLGISKRAAYEMVQNFEIKAIRIGKTFIIPASSFNEFLEERGLIHASNNSEA